VPRGQAEPELADLETIVTYRFDWRTARSLLRNRTLLPLYTQGFFGVFPWNVIAAWFFRYLEIERDYTTDQVLPMMTVAVLCMAAGNVLGGALVDWLFTRTRRGRLLICLVGMLAVMFGCWRPHTHSFCLNPGDGLICVHCTAISVPDRAQTGRLFLQLLITRVTRWFIKPGVSPGGGPIRLRQHGTHFSFSQKNSQREFFCEKDLDLFRPAGG